MGRGGSGDLEVAEGRIVVDYPLLAVSSQLTAFSHQLQAIG